MARLTIENPNVRKFTTNVALGVVKRGLTIPVPLDEEQVLPVGRAYFSPASNALAACAGDTFPVSRSTA